MQLLQLHAIVEVEVGAVSSSRRGKLLAMDSSKTSALLLILMLFISTASPILGSCHSCSKPPHKHKGKSHKGITPPPVIVNPPVTLPPVIGKPPITLPPVIGKPPITLPPVIGKPPITLPPVIGNPPITLPPVGGAPPTTKPFPGCPSPTTETCPIDTLKLGACVDLLGGLVHIGLGDPVVNTCCPVLQGLVELEAAVCLCTTIKLKVLNLNIYVPLALQLLITCGKTPPPGYTCTL